MALAREPKVTSSGDGTVSLSSAQHEGSVGSSTPYFRARSRSTSVSNTSIACSAIRTFARALRNSSDRASKSGSPQLRCGTSNLRLPPSSCVAGGVLAPLEHGPYPAWCERPVQGLYSIFSRSTGRITRILLASTDEAFQLY